MILWIALAIFVVLLIMGAPIILCLGVPPVVWLLTKGRIPNMVMGQKMYGAVDSFSLMAIPFFILGGNIMEKSGISTRLITLAQACVGHFKGGVATIDVPAKKIITLGFEIKR